MPSLTASLTVCLRTFAPCRCPASTGSPRASAQRAFPSMMIATFTARMRRGANLEDLLLFVLEQLVDLVDALVGELLECFLRAGLIIAADLALLLELAQVVHDVAAHVADRDSTVLGDPADHADEFLTAFLGQLGNREADDLAVVAWCQAQVGLHDRLLDRLDRALVVGRDGEHPRLG